MYNFIDVNEVSEGVALPSEALKLNGEYIENLIDGYRTLNVKGREALSPEVVTYDTGIRDGSRLQNKRYPERVITVTYQLIAKTNEDFRAAFNKLGSILDVTDAELIFNDERDMFFKGTPCDIGEIDTGKNAVVGEFKILCTDPFKYSVYEIEAEPLLDEKSFLVDYGGTYKAYPTLEAAFYNESESSEDGETVDDLTGAGDCGFVAFFTEDEKIIQIGDPDEVDGENSIPASQMLSCSTFDKATHWGTAAKSLWATNTAYSGTLHNVEQRGSLKMGVESYAAPSPEDTTARILDATSKANAPIIHYAVTATATNRTANSVGVSVVVKTWLDKDASYFGRGYELMGSIYIGGAWRNIRLKKTTEYWKGASGHLAVLSFTVSGLSESTNVLTGIKFKVTRPDGLGTAGLLSETNCKNLPISPYVSNTPSKYMLTPASYGTGTAWHGATITRTLPADASGEVGAVNFRHAWKHKIGIGSGANAKNQYGAFRCLLISGSGSNRKIVAGICIQKNTVGTKGQLMFYVNGKGVGSVTLDLAIGSTFYSNIDKFGGTVSFDVCGFKYTFRYDELETEAVTQITYSFAQYGAKPSLETNGLLYSVFYKDNCDTWKDIPNKFGANDVVEADCKNGEIYLNGIPKPALGALGNDWESFVLTPGLNQIGFAYSDWLTDEYAPKFKLRYREVFL